MNLTIKIETINDLIHFEMVLQRLKKMLDRQTQCIKINDSPAEKRKWNRAQLIHKYIKELETQIQAI